jgi:polyribonucleotide nucleotidyltransferase
MDQENDPDVLAMVGASAALTISDIHFAGPIAGVRVGRVDGQFIANPTLSQSQASDINLIVAGSKTGVVMVEGGANIVSEADMLEAIFFGHQAMQPLIDIQEQLAKALGKAQTPFPHRPRMKPWWPIGTMAADRMRQTIVIPEKWNAARPCANQRRNFRSLGEAYAERKAEVLRILAIFRKRFAAR